MNWILFDSTNKKTWPIENKEYFIVKTKSNSYSVVKEISDLEVEAWAYIMPFDMINENIDKYISLGCKNSNCKATSFKEFEEKYTLALTVKEFAFITSRLPIYSFSKIVCGSSLSSSFQEDIDHIESNFILENNSDFYLVDTQGYGYCRYTTKLEIKE